MNEAPKKELKPSPIGIALMAAGMFVIGIALVIGGLVLRGFWLLGVPLGALMIYAGFKTAMKA